MTVPFTLAPGIRPCNCFIRNFFRKLTQMRFLNINSQYSFIIKSYEKRENFIKLYQRAQRRILGLIEQVGREASFACYPFELRLSLRLSTSRLRLTSSKRRKVLPCLKNCSTFSVTVCSLIHPLTLAVISFVSIFFGFILVGIRLDG
jgi:hypothetical protein